MKKAEPEIQVPFNAGVAVLSREKIEGTKMPVRASGFLMTVAGVVTATRLEACRRVPDAVPFMLPWRPANWRALRL